MARNVRPKTQARDSGKSGASETKPSGKGESSPAKRPFSLISSLREWTDAIIIAYVLAMFIRTFVVELYKIPSGSMTPTLVGDPVAEVDYNGDGEKDLLVRKQGGTNYGRFQIWLRNGKNWDYQGTSELRGEEYRQAQEKLKLRNDRILVNKFAYFFNPPQRGDLIVFRVPKHIWTEEKPIYIKRAVGLGGEAVSFEPVGDGPQGDMDKAKLVVNNVIVDSPAAFQNLEYSQIIDRPTGPGDDFPQGCEYSRTGNAYGYKWRLERCVVPEGFLLAFGDNTDYSSDGRVWGTIPLENLKGKAFLRYWPLSKMSFLH
jgi:signal peptidase I